MPVIVSTQTPKALLDAIKKEIADKKIDTWKHLEHQQKDYFTHTPSQFYEKAYLLAEIGAGIITFTVVAPSSGPYEKGMYGIYEGRFIEMLLNHFKSKLTQITAD